MDEKAFLDLAFEKFDRSVTNKECKNLSLVTSCPNCQESLDFNGEFSPQVGEIIPCPSCWIRVRVYSAYPVEVEEIPEDYTYNPNVDYSRYDAYYIG